MLVLLVSLSSGAFGASDDLAFEPAPPPEPVCHSACQQCGQQCDPCDLKLCTVMVSACVAETRVKVDVVKEQEEREEQYTAFKLVPKTRKYEKEECYLKREVKTKKVTDEDCHLVKMPVERTKNVKAYHPELREVCSADGACPPRTCEVMVETTVPEATVCEETQVVVSKTEREISYCVRTPKTRKVPCAEEKYYELVPVTKTRKVTVCVPKLVRTPYEVIVCKRIPKEIMCCPACADTPCK
jgi:hypothetical protein